MSRAFFLLHHVDCWKLQESGLSQLLKYLIGNKVHQHDRDRNISVDALYRYRTHIGITVVILIASELIYCQYCLSPRTGVRRYQEIIRFTAYLHNALERSKADICRLL